MKPSERLIAARDYLMEHGWTRHVLKSSDGRVCALGALVCALGALGRIHLITADDPVETDYLYRALDVQRPPGKRAFAVVADFNDDPSTTFNDIIDMYDRAIIIAKEAEAGGAR